MFALPPPNSTLISNPTPNKRTTPSPWNPGAHPTRPPDQQTKPHLDNNISEHLKPNLRDLCVFAVLTQRWRTVQPVTLNPRKIGKITQAALVLKHCEHGYLTEIARRSIRTGINNRNNSRTRKDSRRQLPRAARTPSSRCGSTATRLAHHERGCSVRNGRHHPFQQLTIDSQSMVGIRPGCACLFRSVRWEWRKPARARSGSGSPGDGKRGEATDEGVGAQWQVCQWDGQLESREKLG